MTLTGNVIRKGSALAGLSRSDIAAAADVVVGPVIRIEATDGMAIPKRPDLAATVGALEAAGVESTAQEGGKVWLWNGGVRSRPAACRNSCATRWPSERRLTRPVMVARDERTT